MLNSWQAMLSVVCLSLSGVAVNGSTLEGKIFGSDGQPIKGADVRLQNSSASLEAALTKTDMHGQYRFGNVSPGIYKVSVSPANAERNLTADVKVDGDKRIDLRISPANSAAGTKAKHLARTQPRTGTNIGGGWKDVDNTGASMAKAFKGDMSSMTVVSGAVSRNAASVMGGTRGTFIASQATVKPGSH